jgi:hypothetical protein
MSLRLDHRLMFLYQYFFCPVGNACLALFRLAGIINILSRRQRVHPAQTYNET